LQYESVDPTLIGLIETQTEELNQALALNETLEGKLSEIEGRVETTLEELYIRPLREWQEYTELRTMAEAEQVKILLKAIKTIKELI
jgi:hypothetical protein